MLSLVAVVYRPPKPPSPLLFPPSPSPRSSPLLFSFLLFLALLVSCPIVLSRGVVVPSGVVSYRVQSCVVWHGVASCRLGSSCSLVVASSRVASCCVACSPSCVDSRRVVRSVVVCCVCCGVVSCRLVSCSVLSSRVVSCRLVASLRGGKPTIRRPNKAATDPLTSRQTGHTSAYNPSGQPFPYFFHGLISP